LRISNPANIWNISPIKNGRKERRSMILKIFTEKSSFFPARKNLYIYSVAKTKAIKISARKNSEPKPEKAGSVSKIIIATQRNTQKETILLSVFPSLL